LDCSVIQGGGGRGGGERGGGETGGERGGEKGGGGGERGGGGGEESHRNSVGIHFFHVLFILLSTLHPYIYPFRIFIYLSFSVKAAIKLQLYSPHGTVLNTELPFVSSM
jgi:hypothetical protein